jgi:Xaa-Pro aminopeptidase
LAAEKSDLLQRLKNLQKELAHRDLDAALIWYSRDLYYYSGMVQPAWLAVTLNDYRLFVRAGFSRALADTFLPEDKLEPERNISAVFAFLGRNGTGPVIGTELDIAPANWVERWRSSFKCDFRDLTPAILYQRMKKSAEEVALLRKAQACVYAGHCRIMEVLRPGMSELELSAEVEDAHRRAGHEGTFFMRAVDFFMGRGLFASGPNLHRSTGLAFSLTGVGLSSSVPAGASRRRLQDGDLILVDIPVLVDGYHADHSRTYLLGSKKPKQREWEKALKELFVRTAEVIRPGKTWGECFRQIAALARDLRVEHAFQGMVEGPPLHYIGHGVGLELNEPPLITARNQDPVQTSTVVAIEMHLLEPEGLVIKLEDMLHVGPQSSEYLSLTPLQLFSVG